MDEVVIQTRIDSSLMTRTLARGSVAAGIGIVIIIIAAMELPPELLAIWGIPALILGLALIALGLIPYRILSRRRENPDELVVTEEGLSYSQMGRATLTIPYDAMARISHLNDPPAYGVLIRLKPHPTEKVHVHTHDYDVMRVRHKTRRRFDADLFFPFFQRIDFDELRRGLAIANYTDEI